MQSILHTTLMRHTAFILIAVMSLFSFVPKAEASLVPTAMSMSSELRSQDLASVQKVLENKAVKARLSALGYSDAEISAKLSQVSDSELHGLASQLDALDAGGDGIGFVIGLLVIVLLVIVILKLSDKTVTIR
ncbi:MAG TPA: PA2779 family protein [Humidesulfovibrio sp.]|uniref:PA2779 family protein n=1 Tax=Humidesulfovibrio sp. TaxID=2910988 RepID=UPI002CAD8F52|nr:PA2779 family protein [Humidesulfovibrio sp.]HWR04963.1 PA2779 family protein [Humidesulfovibrio sp.]